MPRITIDAEARQEIRTTLAGLSGARAASEARRFADFHGCHIDRVYAITKDLRPPRKPRVDKGQRKVDLDDPMIRMAMELVVVRGKIDPDLAIEVAEEKFGKPFPCSLGHLQRILRQTGLDRNQRRNPREPYRAFEAKAPLDIFQFDISGLKERWWADVRTRRILHVSPLEVSKNHPNENTNRVPLWCFHIVDDYSRFRYVRFVACLKPNSCHVIDFLWEAFRELGIPRKLYTDRDPIIVSRRMARAASILDRAFGESGGFMLDQHLAGNAKATGKVEVGHQIVAKFWQLIGVKYETPSLENLNLFSARVCERLSLKVHRGTGAMPAVRFRVGHQAIRVPPPAILDSAFKADVFHLNVTGRLTFSVAGHHYQLPRSENVRGLPNPFLALAGKKGEHAKIQIVWPPNEDYFVAIAGGRQIELDRVLAQADEAGQFKTPAESIGQRTRKSLEASAAESKRAFTAAKQQANKDLRAGVITAEERDARLQAHDLVVPGIDKPFNLPAAAAAIFPRKKIETDPALIAALGPGVVAPSMVTGRLVDYWIAARLLAEECLFEKNAAGQVATSDMSWLTAFFSGRDEVLDTELRTAVADRADQSRVLEVKSA